MEINGVAYVVFRAHRFADCISFYDPLLPELGLQCVHPDQGVVYFVGGRTALAIRPVLPECADQRHVEGGPGLDHLCWRVRSREDVDAIYSLLTSMGAEIVRPPQEGPWAPGYYSLSFIDPEGICLEVNYVPGEGVLAEDASFNWDPEYPLGAFFRFCVLARDVADRRRRVPRPNVKREPVGCGHTAYTHGTDRSSSVSATAALTTKGSPRRAL